MSNHAAINTSGAETEVPVTSLTPASIAEAHKRILPYINKTPLMRSSLLNKWLGHEITFKVEAFQKAGSFKSRGALNTLLWLKENGELPQKVVAFSSGNHGQGVAWSASMLGIKSTIFMPEYTSRIKQQATRSYGAEVILTKNRIEAETMAQKIMRDENAYYLPPYDHDMVMAGQGTSAYEAYNEGLRPDAVFATCGGGGWFSGTLLATKLLSPDTKVFAGEPLNANDAARSYQSGKIFRFDRSPETIADGGKALSVSPRTFHFIKQADGFLEITEENIIYWTQWLSHILKATIEPTSAVAMAAAYEWLKTQKEKQNILVMLSGGNIAPESHRIIWQNNYTDTIPTLKP